MENTLNKIEQLKLRTKNFSIAVIKFTTSFKKSDEIQIVCKQLVRSSSSVGANYRAACRARSDAEFFAKMCIVVEEADESCYWLEILESIIPTSDALVSLSSEALEITKIMNAIKHKK